MLIPVIMVLFIKPVDFVHIKERFYKKKLQFNLIITMHQPSDRGEGEA
jgi:hypothetical protein